MSALPPIATLGGASKSAFGCGFMSTGLDWRCSAEVQEITFNPRNSLLLLPNPVREERHEHEMGNDLLFLFHLEGSGIGKVGRCHSLVFFGGRFEPVTRGKMTRIGSHELR